MAENSALLWTARPIVFTIGLLRNWWMNPLPQSDSHDLDQQLLAAHGAADNIALSRLYTKAGDYAESREQIEAACFYLTHAYVFALEQGLPEVKQLHERLVSHGREE